MSLFIICITLMILSISSHSRESDPRFLELRVDSESRLRVILLRVLSLPD